MPWGRRHLFLFQASLPFPHVRHSNTVFKKQTNKNLGSLPGLLKLRNRGVCLKMEDWRGRGPLSLGPGHIRWSTWKLQTGHPLPLGADVEAEVAARQVHTQERNLLAEAPPHQQSCVTTREDANSMGVMWGQRDGPLACQQMESLCDNSHGCPHPRG